MVTVTSGVVEGTDESVASAWPAAASTKSCRRWVRSLAASPEHKCSGMRPLRPRSTNPTADVRQAREFSDHASIEVLMRYDDNRKDIGGEVASKVIRRVARLFEDTKG